MERKNKRPRQEQEEEEMDIGNNGVVLLIKLRKLICDQNIWFKGI